MPRISRKKRVWLLVSGLAICFLVVHGAYRGLSQQRGEQKPVTMLTRGMSLPEGLALDWPGERKSTVSEFRGKVVLINFWAGWCGPCLHEMQALYDLHRRLEGKGFRVVGVNMDDDFQSGLRVLKQRVGEPPFTMLRGVGSALADHFDIQGLPFTVLLDREMKIHFVGAGEANWGSASATKLVEGLL